MRKLLSAVLLALLLFLISVLLVACGGSSSSNNLDGINTESLVLSQVSKEREIAEKAV